MVTLAESSIAGGRAEPILEPTTRLTREQVINRIMTINTSATQAVFAGFGDRELREYLDRLACTRARGRDSIWRRTGSAPAIVWRTARR